MPTPSHTYQVVCEKIINRNNYHTYVVFSGLDSVNLGSIYLWDVQTNVVEKDDDAKDESYAKRYHALDENTIIMSNAQDGKIQSYR